MPKVKPIYHWLPECLACIETRCDQCDTLLRKHNIVSVGMRSLAGAPVSLFVEHQCKDCTKRYLSFADKRGRGTYHELCCMLLEAQQNRQKMEKSMENEPMNKGSIRKSEADAFIKSMNDSHSYEDFLKQIGADKYNIPTEEEED